MEEKIIKKENYFLGIIGALLGGLILAILLAFVYINITWIFLLILSVLIPIFEFYGYKLFRGKIDEKLPIILLIITIINVLIMSFVFFPIALLARSNLPINIETIQNIFKSTRILNSLIQDTLIALAFSMLGVYVVSCITNRKILLNVSKINLFSSDNKEKQEFKEKAINILKPIFEKYGAIEKEKTIKKEEILVEIKDDKAIEYFKYLKQLKIINKFKGKYYYNIDNEKNIRSHYLSLRIISSTCITIIISAITLFVTSGIMSAKTVKVSNKDVEFKIDKSWISLADYSEETGWIYYKNLNSQKDETEQTPNLATMGIAYENTVDENVSSINDIKETLELYINSSPNYESYRLEVFQTTNKYEAIELIIPDETMTEVDYYIYENGKMACVTGILYSNDEDKIEELKEYGKEVANSFKWNK